MPEPTPNLPAVPEDAALAEDVVDGVIVSEEDRAPGAPPLPPVRAVIAVVQVINVVVQHPVARHALYVPGGLVALARQWKRRRTLATALAEQAGTANGPLALQFLQQAELERKGRAERWKQRTEMLGDLLRLSPWIIGLWVLAMVFTGLCLAFAHHRPADLLWPWKTLVTFTADVVAVWTVAVWVLSFGVPLGFLAWLHHLGRTAGTAPGWGIAAKPGEEDRGLIVTADGIAVGLKNLSVPKLDKAFKEGWQPAFHTTPVRDGDGYFSVFSLPMGVTPAMIADKNEVFARNLHRAACEVWVTDAERAKIAPAGFVSLYVLNPGVLDRPTPEYPLMHDGQADVFTGVPGGVLARGDEALIPVTANNGVWGGQMGMGKSNAGRVYVLGCCTDPLCEVEVFVFANNGDYDAYAPRLAAYVKGDGDAVAAAAVQRLYELLDETGRREGRLAELGAKKLTRRIAGQHADMRPLVVLFSECHELFGHPDHGELAAELAVKVIKRARKTGIVLCFDTQSSRAAAIPPALVELVSVNVCFYVKTWRSNDGFLGDGSFQGGIRATELRPNRDVGRSVVTGISDAQFELLKWYLIEVDDDTGWDAATEVIARCMRDLAPGTRASGSDGASLPVIVERDLLADLAMVTDGPWRLSVNELPHRLKRLDGTWPEYRSLTGRQLRARLTELGVKTTNTDNKPELDPAELHRAIADRERMSELP